VEEGAGEGGSRLGNRMVVEEEGSRDTDCSRQGRGTGLCLVLLRYHEAGAGEVAVGVVM